MKCRFTIYSRILLCFLPFLIIGLFSQAQQSRISFKIIDRQLHPVPYATIKVISETDSTWSLDKLTDTAGRAVFQLSGEKFRVTVTSVGYLPFTRGIVIMNNQRGFTFTLQEAITTLGTVVVKSTKPILRQVDDKTIVDPESLAESSTNGYEVLEKTPGLFMDQDGNIYLSSTTPAVVYINGREQKMSTADIASLLKSLPPNSIASIEILRTPSAKYDASGTGGVVNVVLKKGIKIGLTGSLNAGMQQGKYGTQFAGFSLNNNNGALSNYLNVQATRKNSFEEIKTDRIFAPDSLLSQDATTVYPGNNYYLGYGIGYQLNKKWDLNYDGRFSLNDDKSQSSNSSNLSKISSGNVFVDNLANVANKNNVFFLSQGISSKVNIDSAGSEWTNDISFNYSSGKTLQNFSTTNIIPVTTPGSGNADLNTDLQFFSFASDLGLKFPGILTLETGVKTTITRFNTRSQYYHVRDGISIQDVQRTSGYHSLENINAAYVQASKTFAGFTLKAGTRLENTVMKGEQKIPSDTSFTLNRTDFFPYVYFSRAIMQIAGYELRSYLIYRKTISRPGYAMLNPSQRYIDPYLFETGNPALTPQFTQNFEANISVDEKPLFAIGVNNTRDIFTQVVYQSDTSKSVAYRTYDNLGNNKETYFRILGAIPPGGRYFAVAGAQYNHNYYNGFYEEKALAYKKGSWTIFTYQTFKISGTSQITLNGFARFKGQQQFYELSPFGSLNLSLNKQFFKRKLVVTISGSDIFYTNKNNFTLNQGSISASGFRKTDSRRFGVNFRYSFGLRKKETPNNFLNFDQLEK